MSGSGMREWLVTWTKRDWAAQTLPKWRVFDDEDLMRAFVAGLNDDIADQRHGVASVTIAERNVTPWRAVTFETSTR